MKETIKETEKENVAVSLEDFLCSNQAELFDEVNRLK